MPSSAGLNSPELRSRLLLVVVALAALALSLLLAVASAMLQRPPVNGASGGATTVGGRSDANVGQSAPAPAAASTAPPAVSAGGAAAVPPLRTMLEPFAFAVDAIALLGLAAVVVVYTAGRRRGART